MMMVKDAIEPFPQFLDLQYRGHIAQKGKIGMDSQP